MYSRKTIIIMILIKVIEKVFLNWHQENVFWRLFEDIIIYYWQKQIIFADFHFSRASWNINDTDSIYGRTNLALVSDHIKRKHVHQLLLKKNDCPTANQIALYPIFLPFKYVLLVFSVENFMIILFFFYFSNSKPHLFNTFFPK